MTALPTCLRGQARSVAYQSDLPAVRVPFGPIYFGYRADIAVEYSLDRDGLLGHGSFGRVFRCTHLPTGEVRAAKIIKKKGMKVTDSYGSPMPGHEGANDVHAMAAVAAEVAILIRLQQVHRNTHVIGFHGAFETETEVVLIFECGAQQTETFVDLLPTTELQHRMRLLGSCFAFYHGPYCLWSKKPFQVLPTYEAGVEPWLCLGGHLRSLLQQYVDEGHAFCEADTRAVMSQLLSAVTVLHTNGVIHRDIKLDNILLSSNDLKTSVRLADFGTAQYFKVHDLCPFNARIGTERYMAPEVLRGKYSYEADVFSCGVVMYYLLTGQLPFPDAATTLQGNLDTSLLQQCSREAIELLLQMLQRIPEARCTAAQALDSKWIREGTVAATASNIDIGIARRMKQYSEYNKVKHGLLMRLVEQCNPNELMGLQRQFSLMDKNADGSLSLEEVTQALRQFKTGDSGQRVYTDKQIAQMMKSIDADGDGVIDYKEFIASSLSLFQVARGVLPTQRALWYNRLRVVFNDLDKDSNGTVSEEELLSVFPDREEVKKAIQAVDVNNDGHINYEEFLQMMKERELSGPKQCSTGPREGEASRLATFKHSGQGTTRMARLFLGCWR